MGLQGPVSPVKVAMLMLFALTAGHLPTHSQPANSNPSSSSSSLPPPPPSLLPPFNSSSFYLSVPPKF